MLCLHGDKCYATTSYEDDIFWYCAHLDSSCHFICTEDDVKLYAKAVKVFLATKQGRPKCCAITSTRVKDGVAETPVVIGRNYAKMKVKTDPEDDNFGRPYFVCSKKTDRCRYFVWGDQPIIPSPLCEHGKPCHKQKEWKGPNKGRYFFSCAEPSCNIPGRGPCKFLKWMEAEDERKGEIKTQGETK